MAMTQYARNRYVAYKKAANKYGVDYEELKAAYKAKTVPDDENMKKAVNMVHAILRGYGKKYKAANAEKAVVAEEKAEATAEA